MMLKDKCICGHTKEDHESQGPYQQFLNKTICQSCAAWNAEIYNAKGQKGFKKVIHEFKLDNLKYLERLYEERKGYEI